MAKQNSGEKQRQAKDGPKEGKPKTNPGQIIQDERFAAAYSDPRFQRFPKAHGKVEIDDRFAGMFKDKAFQVRSAVDKRGRKLGKQAQHENMRKYYRLQNEEEDRKKGGAGQPAEGETTEAELEAVVVPSKAKRTGKAIPAETPAAQEAEPEGEETSEDEDSESLDEDDARAQERWARVRGLTGPQASSSDDDGSSDDDDQKDAAATEDEDVDLAEWGVGAMAANPDEAIPQVEEETSRLALVDLDWSKVRAVDIFAMLKSFVAKGQHIKRVTVYPSDYGLARMAKEAKLGPVGLFGAMRQAQDIPAAGSGSAAGAPSDKLRRKKRISTLVKAPSRTDAGSESDSEGGLDGGESSELDMVLAGEDEERSESDGKEFEGSSGSDSESGDEVDHRRLQLYERSRLRYYYAIVECSDVATAAHLYSECDGMEFEHSANKLDLRYVPEGQSFVDRKARDVAEEVPADYEAPIFGTAALQHTRAKLTWDADDDNRKKLLAKRVTKDQMREDDFKAYLGSESEEEEEVEEPQAQRYRDLLMAGADPRHGGKAWGAEEGTSDADADSEAGVSGSEEEEEGKAQVMQSKKDRSMELEVTFAPALDELGQRLSAKKKDKANSRNDTVWEAYLRRRRQKREDAKRHGKRADSDDDYSSDGGANEADPYFQHDNNDDAFDDPFFQDGDGATIDEDANGKPAKKQAKSGDVGKAARAASKAEKREQEAEERRRRAELELLLMDDAALQDAAKLGSKLMAPQQPNADVPKTKVSRKARLAAKKAARLARRAAGSDDDAEGVAAGGNGFNVDLGDQRFAALYESADFALDPTDPRFSASIGAKAILAEASKRRKKGDKLPSGSTDKEAAPHPVHPVPQVEAKEDNLKAMVASLKRKAGAKKVNAGTAGGSQGKPKKKKTINAAQ